jgi:hypothetical protein
MKRTPADMAYVRNKIHVKSIYSKGQLVAGPPSSLTNPYPAMALGQKLICVYQWSDQ